MTQKGFDLDHIKLIWNLNMDEIKFVDYLRRRGLNKNGDLGELNNIINDNHHMLNEFLAKISVGYFINGNMSHNKDSEIVSQRNTSLELIYDLAIIYDLPFRYLADTYTKYEMISAFTEYNTPKIKVNNLHELIEEILIGMKNEPSNKRNIFGVKIVNDFFEAGEKKYLYTRVDIRERFFTIEMHLENQANINSLELLKLESSMEMNNEIYIRDAFLRDNKKNYILISLDELLKPNVIYLQEEFLWRNVIGSLKKGTLIKLEKEKITVLF